MKNNLTKPGKRLIKNSAKRNDSQSEYNDSEGEIDQRKNYKPSDRYAKDHGLDSEPRKRIDSNQYFQKE